MTNSTEAERGNPGALRRPPEIRAMFDRITRRYDLMNRLMTGGMDVAWRRKAARTAIGAGATRVLDVATGTADLALELARQGVPQVVGVDFAGNMLSVAQAKIARSGDPGDHIRLTTADAMKLPFPDGTFDACTVGFGLRNMPDYAAAVAEMARVLAPGGRLVVLEMTPLRPPLRGIIGFYCDRLIPLVGGLVSGDPDAYRYLPHSIGVFPDAETLKGIMREAGLRNVRYELLALGTVALHIGIKR